MTVDVLRYRSGEVIETGDRVMEPVNGGQQVGTVVEVLQPGTDQATATGYPGGGIGIEWDGGATEFWSPCVITELGGLFFLGRRP